MSELQDNNEAIFSGNTSLIFFYRVFSALFQPQTGQKGKLSNTLWLNQKKIWMQRKFWFS